MSLLEEFVRHRTEVLDGLVRDLPVPRYSRPQVLVRVRPLDDDTYLEASERAGSTDSDRIDYAARIVATACVGVYLHDPTTGVTEPACADGGDPPTFTDGRVAPLVGAETGGAVELVRALFATEADIAAAMDAVLGFTGYGRRIALKAVAGKSPATP
ncbi:hypothetical protein [Euzebya rosea]|uniref:hypothetical protein n=1 Tax=Euzebya rosea TaxID=2052804 RepID=UPI000D3EC2C3|nr:hypothetical protein [Euzebya rosea]